MITITGIRALQGEKGAFIALELLGDVEMVQSQSSGRFYATARRCSVPSSFDEQTAHMMIGRTMPGTIERVQCAAYDFTVPETGEVIKLAHTYQYVPPKTQALFATPLPQAATL